MNAPSRWLRSLAMVALLAGLAPAAGLAQQVKVKQTEIDWGAMLAALLKSGPDFIHSSRAVSGTGVVRGGWPLVVDYKLATEGTLEIQLTVQGGSVEPIRLPGGERRVEVVRLPPSAGEAIGAGQFEIRAIGKTGEPIEFDLYGIGAGEKAVGSMAIVDVEFGPPTIRLKKKEQANFSFRTRKDFNLASAAVYSPGNGGNPSQKVWMTKLDCVPSTGQVCKGSWPGRSDSGKPSKGPHVLEVKAWAGATEGHWNKAVAPGRVDVER